MAKGYLAIPLILSLASPASAGNEMCETVPEGGQVCTEMLSNGGKYVSYHEDSIVVSLPALRLYVFDADGNLTHSKERDLNGLDERRKDFIGGVCVKATYEVDYEDDIFETYEGMFPFEDVFVDKGCDGTLDSVVNARVEWRDGHSSPTEKHQGILKIVQDANPGRS